MMSSLINRLFHIAFEGLWNRDSERCDQVVTDDHEIDILEKQVDQVVLATSVWRSFANLRFPNRLLALRNHSGWGLYPVKLWVAFCAVLQPGGDEWRFLKSEIFARQPNK